MKNRVNFFSSSSSSSSSSSYVLGVEEEVVLYKVLRISASQSPQCGLRNSAMKFWSACCGER
jgi:hypothetical protein